MFIYEDQAVQTHDLLHINLECLLDDGKSPGDSVPRWAEEHLRAVPFVVVRRGLISETCLPIGVRGSDRSQRCAASCSPHAVLRVIPPSQLLGRPVVASRVNAIPALQALALLRTRWADFDCPWGPGGSIGFELATGMNVAKAESDLDIVIRATRPITIEEAKFLCAQAMDLPAIVDIRVETPICGFSLQEYARADRKEILLRTQDGPVLVSDPWRNEPDILSVANSFEKAGL